MRKVLLAASAAFALCAGSALAQQGVTDTEILIGDVAPYSGPPALLGTAHHIGTKAAVAEINAAGGINGRKVRVIAEDDGYVTARTIQAVRKMITVDKVFALTAISGSGQAIGALPVVEDAGIPVMVTVATVKQLYDPPVKNVFAIGQSYDEGIRQLTLYLAKKNPGKKWALITQDDDYGVAVRDGYQAAQKDVKINTVFATNYKKGQQDFSSEMLRLKDSGAEVFLAGGIIGENVAMVKELERLGVKPITGIFWPGRVEVVLKLMGPASDGIYAVDYVEPLSGPAGKAFIDKIKPLLTEDEFKGVNRYTMTGYAGAKTMFEAFRRCGKNLTWACTIAELEKLKNFETGVTAPISFGPNVRYSAQQVKIMQADFANLTFKPAP